MENVDSNYIIREIKEKIETAANEVILDVSTFPELDKIVKIRRIDFKPVYYIPDTIYKLFTKAEKDIQYYQFITDLFRKWTTRTVDFNLLYKIFREKKINEMKFELITRDMVDSEVYKFCYEKLRDKNLIVELSPETNVLGDVIGKILGFAKKSQVSILMLNRKLVTLIRGVIPVFDAANTFVDKKQEFFSRFIPVKRARGVKWFIGIAIGLTLTNHPAGVVLAIIDP